MHAEGQKKTWRLPTLPHCCSTIGVRALDFRVRDGNGYYHSAMATRSAQMWKPEVLYPLRPLIWAFRKTPGCDQQYGQAIRMISTAGLNALLHLHPRPIDQIVSLVPY